MQDNLLPTPNPEYLDGDTPTINLGGTKWPLPKLAFKQNKKVVGLITQLLPRMKGLIALADDKNWQNDPVKVQLVMDFLTEENVDVLGKMIYHALTRAHPTLTYEQFENMEFDPSQLFMAFPLVLGACGMFKMVAVPMPGEKSARRKPKGKR